MNDQQYLKELYLKLLVGTINKEELLWFKTHMESESGRKEMLVLVTKELAISDDESTATLSEQKVIDRVYKRIYRRKFENLKTINLNLWYRIAAVAAIVFLMLGGYFFKSNQSFKLDSVHVQQVIGPGSNKAVLTLASGNRILINDRSDKTLLIQQGIDTSKVNHGQLTYMPAKNNNFESEKLEYNTAETPKGGQFQIILSDGTKVVLNSASSLKFPTVFKRGKRIVEITGEGYFEVSKDKAHPFIVKTDKHEIEVLGTHFNVNSYKDEQTINTNLFEGAIRINSSVYLKPGQQADIDNSGHIIVTKGNQDAIAWKEGKFVFDNTSLEVVMRQLSRWYDVNIEYQGTIPNMKFTGVIDRNLNAVEALEILKYLKVNFKIVNRTIFVSK